MTNDKDIIDNFLDDDIPVVNSSGARHVVLSADVDDSENSASTPPVAASNITAAASTDAAVSAVQPSAAINDLTLGDGEVPDEVKAVTESEQFKEMRKGTKAIEVIWGRMADESVSELQLDEDMRRRFRKIAELYYRDLRDSLETVSKMTMPIASGGMGMNDEQADEVMALLKAKNDDLQAELKSQTDEGKESYLSGLAAESLQKASQEAQADKEELDEMYARITDKADRPVSAPVQRSAEPIRIPVMNRDEPAVEAVEAKPVENVLDQAESIKMEAASTPPTDSAVGAMTETVEPPPNLPIEETSVKNEGNVAPSAAVQAGAEVQTPAAEPEPAPETVESQPETVSQPEPSVASVDVSPKHREQESVAAVLPSPPTPPVKPEPPTAAPVTVMSSDKPRVSDVTPTPRLTGPVEELGQFNLADFRRLSKDPKEACLKVLDKIDILGEQSFQIKNRGVKAWQESPVNRLYLEILRESLEGKSVSGIIDAREAGSKGTLHKNEFDALMDLNRKLRFG